jgi:hypothetical protein
MIPVPGLDSVRCAWVEIQKEGFRLHGFLLYRSNDHYFPEYLDGPGLDDLNTWTGDECGVFVIQSPSAKWIEYTRTTNHTWWKLFGKFTDQKDEFLQSLSREIGGAVVLSIDGETLTLRDVFAPCLNHFHHSEEIGKILRRFGLRPTDHPCLVLFRDITDREVWFVDLRDMRGESVAELGEQFQSWFGGPEFDQIMKEAQHA